MVLSSIKPPTMPESLGYEPAQPSESSEPNSTTPLISRPGNNQRTISGSSNSSRSSLTDKQHRGFLFVTTICVLSLFLIEIGDYMQRAPWIRILEANVCRTYYLSSPVVGLDPSKPIPEARCKIEAVQAELAMLKGWDLMFSCLPSILTAIPYGYMADKYGRKVVLLMALSGILLGLCWINIVGYFDNVFDIKWIWAGNAFLFLGGGSTVVRAMFFTIVTDGAKQDRRYGIRFLNLISLRLCIRLGGVYLENCN
jgi:MFS family permease